MFNNNINNNIDYFNNFLEPAASPVIRSDYIDNIFKSDHDIIDESKSLSEVNDNLFDMGFGNKDGILDQNSVYIDEENNRIFLDSDLKEKDGTFSLKNLNQIDDINQTNIFDLLDVSKNETYEIFLGSSNLSINTLSGEDIFKQVSDVQKRFYHFSQDNVNNIVVSNSVKKNVEKNNDDGELIGYADIETQYNANGDEVSKTLKHYNSSGIFTGVQNIEYIYDENGVKMEETSVSLDKNGNVTLQVGQKFNKTGNVIEQYSYQKSEDGNIISNYQEFLYEEKKYPSLCKGIKEKTVNKDKNGNIIYQCEKQTEKSILSSLQDYYSDKEDMVDYDKFQKAKSLKKAMKILSKNNISVDNNLSLSLMRDSLLDSEAKAIQLEQSIINEVIDELEAKLELNVNKGILDPDYLKQLEKFKEDSGANMYSSESLREISVLYKNVNNILYPDGSHSSLMEEVFQIYDSKNYLDNLKDSGFDISENFAINDSSSSNYGAMLMKGMQNLRKDYELYNDQMGDFDKIISLCNYFGILGTSAKEVDKMFELYEKELKNLSKSDGDEFLRKIKALTGEDFSEELLVDIQTKSILIDYVDVLDEEQLKAEAEKLGIDLKIAEIMDYSTGKKTFDIDALNQIVKREYISSSKNNTILDGTIEDYKQTIKEHRDFVVNIVRSGATMAVSSTGVGLIACCATGAFVESIFLLANSNATGEQAIDTKEALSKIISGAIASGTQGGTQKLLNGLGLTYDGQSNTLSMYKMLQHGGSSNAQVEVSKTLYDIVDKVCLKGISANSIDIFAEYLIQNVGDEEMEPIEFVAGLLKAEKDGLIDGVLTGLFLVLFENALEPSAKNKVNSFIDENCSPYLKQNMANISHKVTDAAVHSSIEKASDFCSTIATGLVFDIEELTSIKMEELISSVFDES